MNNSELFDDMWHRPKKIDHSFCKGDTFPTTKSHPPEQRTEVYSASRKPFNQRAFRIQRAIETLEDPNPRVMEHRYSVDIVLTGLREAFQLSAERLDRLNIIAQEPAAVIELNSYPDVA